MRHSSLRMILLFIDPVRSRTRFGSHTHTPTRAHAYLSCFNVFAICIVSHWPVDPTQPAHSANSAHPSLSYIPLVWSASGLVGYKWGSLSPVHSFTCPIHFLFSLLSFPFFFLPCWCPSDIVGSPRTGEIETPTHPPPLPSYTYPCLCPAPCVLVPPSVYLCTPLRDDVGLVPYCV
jgi:hypothetical protein